MKKIANWISWNVETEHLILGVAVLAFIGGIVHSCITYQPVYMDEQVRALLSNS